jgi:hypothetical protein
MMFRSGRIRGEKIRYEDGVGCCIWLVFPGDEGSDMEDCGLCFDFSDEHTDDMIKVLAQIKECKDPPFYKEETDDD